MLLRNLVNYLTGNFFSSNILWVGIYSKVLHVQLIWGDNLEKILEA